MTVPMFLRFDTRSSNSAYGLVPGCDLRHNLTFPQFGRENICFLGPFVSNYAFPSFAAKLVKYLTFALLYRFIYIFYCWFNC